MHAQGVWNAKTLKYWTETTTS